MQLNILSGGAAQSVVNALAAEFRAATGYELACTFSAVGAMREKLLAGAPADLVILTRAVVAELAAGGQVLPDSCADLGCVRTGVAVRSGDKLPDIAGAEALRSALLSAEGIYFPDPKKATAGIHFVGVLDKLGIRGKVEPRLKSFPNGNTAMRELALATGARLIGCTQVTEIKSTRGVVLAGLLPREFELATVYSVAVCAGAASPEAARRFAGLLTGASSRTLRQNAGFEIGTE
ncbi:MAG: ABC transporter substrate-binding protein [Betaproteobacteria bacterium]|nr:MAG: ABC transporter substrate-binding protein [Betaproteobacteria bacterium]